MSYKIRVMLSHLRQKTGFKATANTCKKSVECVPRPQSFLAKGLAYGGGVTEGKHLGRTIRWIPQGFEWEANSKHVDDMWRYAD